MLILALLLAAAPPADVAVSEDTDLLSFSYAWPAAAGRDPALAAELRRRLAAARRESLGYARDDRRERPADAPFNPHSYSATWTVDGMAGPLISLSASIGTYTGGAHGNHMFERLLWDSTSHREVDAHAVLGPGLARMAPRYCAALNVQRAEKREAPVLTDPDDPFTACPPIAQERITLADKDGNGRFDTLQVLLPPYEAGPYVEGDYVVEVPFEADDLAAIPPRYRAAFETPDERR